MTKSIYIGQNYAIANLIKFAEKVVTEEGKTYYRFPCWFEQLPDNFEFVIHTENSLPEDLSTFICKAGLGQPNPQIKKTKL